MPRLHRRSSRRSSTTRTPKTREIAAWWLRRRIFGVFGPGEVYQQTVQTLADRPRPGAPLVRRLRARRVLRRRPASPPARTALIDRRATPGVRAAAATRARAPERRRRRRARPRRSATPTPRCALAALASAGADQLVLVVPSVAALTGRPELRRAPPRHRGARRARRDRQPSRRRGRPRRTTPTPACARRPATRSAPSATRRRVRQRPAEPVAERPRHRSCATRRQIALRRL